MHISALLSGPGESVTVVLGAGTDCEVYIVYVHIPSMYDVHGVLLLTHHLCCSQDVYPIIFATPKAATANASPSISIENVTVATPE
jgi:hypothetical protein